MALAAQSIDRILNTIFKLNATEQKWHLNTKKFALYLESVYALGNHTLLHLKKVIKLPHDTTIMINHRQLKNYFLNFDFKNKPWFAISNLHFVTWQRCSILLSKCQI
jgi:hypothetical protein